MYIYENEPIEMFNIKFDISKNREHPDKNACIKKRKSLSNMQMVSPAKFGLLVYQPDSQEEGGVTANTTHQLAQQQP